MSERRTDAAPPDTPAASSSEAHPSHAEAWRWVELGRVLHGIAQRHAAEILEGPAEPASDAPRKRRR